MPGATVLSRVPARAFTLNELLVVIVIILLASAVAVPPIMTMVRDAQVSRARSDVFAALSAARSRAIRDHTPVALHVFRDMPAYRAAQIDPNDPDNKLYNQSYQIRWGCVLDASTNTYVGVPHVPTGKMIMRLEVPNPFRTNAGSVEFVWPADHDPIVLPDLLGISRPETRIFDPGANFPSAAQGSWVDITAEVGPSTQLGFHEDFYVVFGDDGKVTTVLVDYSLDPTNAASPVTKTTVLDPLGNSQTYSASGLCIYETAAFRALTDNGDDVMTDNDRYSYVNRADNRIVISPYTGLALTQEATR